MLLRRQPVTSCGSSRCDSPRHAPRLRPCRQPGLHRSVALGLYIFVFFVLHLPVRGDVPTFYVVPGSALALQEAAPVHRLLHSSYAPLHRFLDAGLLLLWNSPIVIILFAIVAECLVLPVWLRAARLFASRVHRSHRRRTLPRQRDERAVRHHRRPGQCRARGAAWPRRSRLLLARALPRSLSGAVLASARSLIKFLPLALRAGLHPRSRAAVSAGSSASPPCSSSVTDLRRLPPAYLVPVPPGRRLTHRQRSALRARSPSSTTLRPYR